MKKQDSQHHIRFYAPHHFVFYPLLLAGIIGSISCISRYPEEDLIWKAITGLLILITWLSFMTRQHYALTAQNRTVRLEMRLRYYILTQKRLEPIEEKLSFGQLAALRFASDEELPALIERTLTENLSPKSIKDSIKKWQPDHMRV